jgi:hypothetical protein
MIKLYETHAADKAKIQTCHDHWLFNSYLFGPTDDATDTTVRLYKPGDFLIHLAGVYDPWNMYRFMKYVRTVHVPDPAVLNRWRKELVASKEAAELSLASNTINIHR